MRAARKPTITDVAREAGVSVGTVSHVLNGTTKVSATLRERVEQTMSRLGYEQNMLAHAQRRQRAPVVGLSVPHVASAYLAEIWRGGVEAIPAGQWDAAAALGLRPFAQMRLVILPQAFRITLAPTVGFLVQLVKSTALTSIIGFGELLKTADAINNAVFQPFLVYGLVALIFFVLCFPLTLLVKTLDRRGPAAARS